MSRKLTPRSSLENLRREAKRWLQALRANDADARARLARAYPGAPATPGLRDVQHALAREHGIAGWTALRNELARRAADSPGGSRDAAIQALLAAAERGDAVQVGALLDAHPDIVDERAVLPGHTGRRTALHFAMNRLSEAVVDALLARGADPNVRDEGDNAMPLHFAAERGHLGIVRRLIEHGADVEARDAAGLTPLDQAALRGEREMAERLIAHGARIELPAAVALDRRDDIERLLRDDPDCLRPGGRWDKLIIRASERAPAPVVETLIRAGASVHVRDDYRTSVDGTHGYTALHAAAFHGNAAVARVLLRHGADPTAREDRYWGTPAGWAAYAGHTGVRDLILDAPVIDIFDAILYDRNERIGEILERDPLSLNRKFGEYVTGDDRPKAWLDPAWTPAAFAVANGKVDALRVLIDRGADLSAGDSAGRSLLGMATAEGREDIAALLSARDTSAPPRSSAGDTVEPHVADFLTMACLDWRVGGSQRAFRMYDASRILERHPELARASIYTAVAGGEIDEVRRILAARPEAASELGGPRSWPPLLYLCSARLTSRAASDNAVAIARLLLDHGADPNAFYLGGNADIHYTALTCVLGRGEEMASMHPRARELTRLLLERGADPHDNQVLYNVFADNTSRHLLDADIVWLLDLMHEHSVRRGHKADWENPAWPMFDMRGAPSLGHEDRRHFGARFMLEAAIDRNLLQLADWMLAHGAGPNTPLGNLWEKSSLSLYQEAIARGNSEMAELLVHYGATAAPRRLEGIDAFVDACLAMDRGRVRGLLAQHAEYLSDHRPAFAAVDRDRADVLEMLLDLGVSPDVENPNGRTRALHVAAAKGAERCATLLIERGADVDARDTNHDGVPLGWASFFQQHRMVELLGRHSREVWQLTYTGQVARLRDIVREEPSRARVTSRDGGTPLMWLPNDARSALEIASLLLEHGADPAARNAQGLSAADIATRRGLDAVAALLRSDGG